MKLHSGPYASRRYTYSPPAPGIAAESSAYDNAPDSDITPPTTQTTKTIPGVPIFRIMTLGTMKIPLPITVPTTMATALHSPKSRFSDTADGDVLMRVVEF